MSFTDHMPSPLRLNPLFLAASPVHQQAIMSATRGCDIDPHDSKTQCAKARYTTPIRCWLWQCDPQRLTDLGCSGGDAAKRTYEEWRNLALEVTWCPDHYTGHLCNALHAIAHLESPVRPK